MARENYQAAMDGLCVDGEHADFRVVVGEEVILVHRLIVSIRSPYFKTAISTPVEGKKKDEVIFDTTQTTAEVVRQAINFMYGSDIKEGITDHSGLLDIAELLVMEDFKEAVDKYLVKNNKVSSNNLVELCKLANKYRAPLLAGHCAQFLLGTTADIAPAMADMTEVTAAALRLARDTVQVVRSQKTKRCGGKTQCEACEGGREVAECVFCGGECDQRIPNMEAIRENIAKYKTE